MRSTISSAKTNWKRLLAKGGGWLAAHPEKEQITRRVSQASLQPLSREALARLAEGEEKQRRKSRQKQSSKSLEKTLRVSTINLARNGRRCDSSKRCPNSVDLGCGEGKLLRELLQDRRSNKSSAWMSRSARWRWLKRLKLDRLPERQAERLKLIHGSLIYRDKRLEGYDAAAVVEVVEHLDPPGLSAFERVLFEFARPKTVVLTTPNRVQRDVENAACRSVPARRPSIRGGVVRSFRDWANRIGRSTQPDTQFDFLPVGRKTKRSDRRHRWECSSEVNNGEVDMPTMNDWVRMYSSNNRTIRLRAAKTLLDRYKESPLPILIDILIHLFRTKVLKAMKSLSTERTKQLVSEMIALLRSDDPWLRGVLPYPWARR
ncbi:MAG: hypothetical protein R3C05_06665 [Pirellulaceae bacterium]